MNPSTSQPLELRVIDGCTTVEPETPLQSIALTFSGGGFRAASFSLGVLSYLHRIPFQNKSLLQKVRFITSTSGGSITNAGYVSSLYTNPRHSFPSFYQELREKMEGEQLLQEASEYCGTRKAGLNPVNIWTKKATRPSSKRNEISSMPSQKHTIKCFSIM
ncbi:patatin-like phospholipase family protein [Pseudobacter ginsenosidimutans]|uniref:patatin-like phospholipase family protein n=1 Tax=Pseudobacter ginsenosidimutans TaxID=661488 RepID=UPI00131515BE|nr:patatin-like phospholipase family protein [Pseudobacter ginsenosidimutans]